LLRISASGTAYSVPLLSPKLNKWEAVWCSRHEWNSQFPN